jgi:hypothetical protein
MPMVYINPLTVGGMMLLIFSDMPTFAVGLILKHLSWHAAVKPVWAF